MGLIMLVIGSLALQHHIKTLDMSSNKDIDVICYPHEMLRWAGNNQNVRTLMPIRNTDKWVAFLHNQRIVEFELLGSTTSSDLIKQMVDPDNTSGSISADGWIGDAMIAPIEILYLIKMSHRFKKNTPFFKKTHDHIMAIRDAFPSIEQQVSDDSYQEMLKLREKESYTYAHPKLNVSKQDFFNPDIGVDYVYDHDEIHKIVARGKSPAYSYFIMDGEDVMCDKEKFFALPLEIQLNAVFEESTVLALERSQIPFKDQVDPKRSFDMALEKVCTSITSGWFRTFAWEHFRQVEKMYQSDYADHFFNCVDRGLIIPQHSKPVKVSV